MKAGVRTGQCLANAGWLIAYVMYGRILDSEKGCVIISVIIDLLCLHEHNICETKLVLLAQLPLQTLHSCLGSGVKHQYFCVWLCHHTPLSQGQLETHVFTALGTQHGVFEILWLRQCIWHLFLFNVFGNMSFFIFLVSD